MKKLLLLPLIAVLGCESDTPLGDVSGIEGNFQGTWTLSWGTNNPNINPPGITTTCPGSIGLGDRFRDAFGGAFLIFAEGGCTDGSPVSGEVVSGRARADGGVNFTLQVPPTRGEEKFEDDIWEDIFAGSGVILPDLIIGCRIVDADNQFTGAVLGSNLGVSASAGVECPGPLEPILVQLQVRFAGDR